MQLIAFRFIGIIAIFTASSVLAAEKTEQWELLGSLHPAQRPHLLEHETQYLRFDTPEAFACLGENWGIDNLNVYRDKDKVWGMRDKMDMELVIFEPGKRTLQLEMQPHHIPNKPQVTKVLFNGQPLGECRFDPAKGWNIQHFDLTVPVEIQRVGKNTVTFISRFAISAKESGRNADTKKLAFYLNTLRFCKEDTAATEIPDTEREFLRNQGDGTQLLVSSRLHFPTQVPDAEKVELRFGDTGSGTAPKVLVADESSQLNYQEQSAKNGVVDLTRYAGQLVDIVFDATKEDCAWAEAHLWVLNSKVQESQATEKLELPQVENLVLIILDALRADSVGCYGYLRDTSPTLDAIAEKGVRFDCAIASAPFTYSSTWSLLTGAHSFQHGAVTDKLVPSHELKMLPDVLSESGVYTACVTANAFLDNENLIERFDEFHLGIENLESLLQEKRRDATLVTKQAIDFIDKSKGRPFFLYLHYLQPHEPYYPAMPFLGHFNKINDGALNSDADTIRKIKLQNNYASAFQLQDLRARYDENLLDVDAQVKIVLDELERQGIQEKTAVLVTADHGEAFWEHGSLGHSTDVYNEMLRIPFILYVPGAEKVGKLTHRIISTVDIFPTVCSLLGAPIPDYVAGSSVMRAQTSVDTPLAYAGIHEVNNPREAYYFQRYKLRRNDWSHHLEVFDLLADPGEMQNLAVLRPILTMKLLAESLWWKRQEEKTWAEKGKVPEPFTKPEQNHMKELEALGYF